MYFTYFKSYTFRTYTVLPKTATPTSPVVAIVRPGTYDPDKYAFSEVFSVSLLIQNVILLLLF